MPETNEIDMTCAVCEGTWGRPELRYQGNQAIYCKADCHDEKKWAALIELERRRLKCLSAWQVACGRIAKLERSHNAERAEWWYELAKLADEKWKTDVADRPMANVYRAGMDKVWKWLEAYALEQREAIDAVREDKPHE
ncbi:MAG: hypothetical protein QQN63_10335 [Nitrosopumilus sp.]